MYDALQVLGFFTVSWVGLGLFLYGLLNRN